MFEFDCDTDGGLGTNGAAMVGCVIWITLAGGRTLGSELHVDPNSVIRSVAGFR